MTDLSTLNTIPVSQAFSKRHLILTPNMRLVRVLNRQFFEGDIQPTVVTAPQIFSLWNWWRDQTQQLITQHQSLLSSNSAKWLLSDLQAQLLWRESISSDASTALLNEEASVRLASTAHSLSCQWQLDDMPAQDAEVNAFRRWRKGFIKAADRLGAMDSDSWKKESVMQLGPLLRLPELEVCLLGFVELTPLEQQLVALIQSAGAQIVTAHWPKAMVCNVLAYDDLEQEIRAAAVWAKQQHQELPDAKIAVVVNKLGQQRQLILQTFEQVLHPDAYLHFGLDYTRSFNCSLGAPLDQFNVCHSALNLLQWAMHGRQRPLTFSQWQAWLKSPYLGGGQKEMQARARLCLVLRKQKKAKMSLLQFIEVFASDQYQVPIFISQLKQLSELQYLRGNEQQWLVDVLSVFSWPGERQLQSSEVKTYNAVVGAIHALPGLLSMQKGQVKSLAGCLSLLRFTCRNSVHQNLAADDAPIQILGVLEAVGQRFDAVRVLNLTDRNWPESAQSNPFIPYQQQKDIPNGSASRQLGYSELLQQQLLALSNQVTFTSHWQEAGVEVKPSYLIESLVDALERPAAVFDSHYQLDQNIPASPFHHPYMSYQPDEVAPASDVEDGQVLKGGAYLLKNQAFCPAVAFAQYRLFAQEVDEPTEEIDALDRGNLIHQVLDQVWADIEDLDGLNALSAEQLQQLFEDKIDFVIERLNWQELYPQQHLQLEKQRALHLLIDYMAKEAKRSWFEVVEREYKINLTLGELVLSAVIDRVDKLADGGILVVDYKSGYQDIKRCLDDRLLEPQLPLYAVSQQQQGQAIKGVVLALIGAARFSSVVDNGTRMKNAWAFDEVSERNRLQDPASWSELLQRWREQLTGLVEEFRNGHCSAYVYDEDQLQYCDLRPLLRWPEQKLQKLHWQTAMEIKNHD